MPPVPDLTYAAVRGLDDYRQRVLAARVPTAREACADKVLLSAIGIGIGEVLPMLHQDRPDFASFCRWIEDRAGPPAPQAIARFHAWLDGEPASGLARAELDAIKAMAPVLCEADLAQWHEQGVIVVRGAISHAEARAAERVLWDTLKASPDDPESWPRAASQGIWVDLFHHPVMEPARRSRRVHKAFAQLWGTADLWLTIDRMGFNPPATPADPYRGHGIHWDASLAKPIPFGTQAILYLTETSADQGALRVVPGFHRIADEWLDRNGRENPHSHDFTSEARPIPAGAGDLVIWHHALPHDASPNRSPRPRLTQYLNMFAADGRSNPV